MPQKLKQCLVVLVLLCGWSSPSHSACSNVGGMGPNLYTNADNSIRWFSWAASQQPIMTIGYMTTGALSVNKPCIGKGCNPSTVPFRCQAHNFGEYASFLFAKTMMTLADGTSNFCTFSTAMGSVCRIQGETGLPVELMEFGIEE